LKRAAVISFSAHRDVSYLKVAYQNFVDLIRRFPSSQYSVDAAQHNALNCRSFAPYWQQHEHNKHNPHLDVEDLNE
jgi:hypothetical protein